MKGFLLTLLIFWIISRLVRKNVYINTFNYNQPPSDANHYSKKKEGEISIDQLNQPKKNKKDKDDGEFVDYEELK